MLAVESLLSHLTESAHKGRTVQCRHGAAQVRVPTHGESITTELLVSSLAQQAMLNLDPCALDVNLHGPCAKIWELYAAPCDDLRNVESRGSSGKY